MHLATERAAFFDVDETLIVTKSMLSFLEHHWWMRGHPRARFLAARRTLDGMVTAGAPRQEVNRAYYRLLEGCDTHQLRKDGRSWFVRERRRGLFHPPVLAAFQRHSRRGDLTVLVSGSFEACLGPIATYLGADQVLCTVPHVVDGVLTGEVDTPALGEHKRTLAATVLRQKGIDARTCSAYGDDASDLPLLELVGRPVVVGCDAVLSACARERRWPTLPPTVRR